MYMVVALSLIVLSETCPFYLLFGCIIFLKVIVVALGAALELL